MAKSVMDYPARQGSVTFGICNHRVSHRLAEGVALTCEIERFDPNSPPWEAVAVRLSIPFA